MKSLLGHQDSALLQTFSWHSQLQYWLPANSQVPAWGYSFYLQFLKHLLKVLRRSEVPLRTSKSAIKGIWDHNSISQHSLQQLCYLQPKPSPWYVFRHLFIPIHIYICICMYMYLHAWIRSFISKQTSKLQFFSLSAHCIANREK